MIDNVLSDKATKVAATKRGDVKVLNESDFAAVFLGGMQVLTSTEDKRETVAMDFAKELVKQIGA